MNARTMVTAGCMLVSAILAAAYSAGSPVLMLVSIPSAALLCGALFRYQFFAPKPASTRGAKIFAVAVTVTVLAAFACKLLNPAQAFLLAAANFVIVVFLAAFWSVILVGVVINLIKGRNS